MRIDIGEKVLQENAKVAAELRAMLTERGIVCVNLIGSPGSGKTAILERTLANLRETPYHVAVLTGDIQTDADAQRLSRYGFPARQITTGGACHLDARMVLRGMDGWDTDQIDLLLIENVGNLVCPTSYDLGEEAKIVVLSVTEGEEKPLKYPGIFFRSALMLMSKCDLLPYVPFDPELAARNARTIHPEIEVVRLSASSGEGFGEWMQWLHRRLSKTCVSVSSGTARR
uniref:Hydrogenase accessory protein HypB n=1 Tax=Solibacter usitatus (strain Ellin6076) TaxID=234267 RepID=Q01R75_SOLUE